MPKPTDDPLLALIDRGGVVWAFRYRYGTVLTLSHVVTHQGATAIDGFVANGDSGLDRDELMSLGWRPTAGGLKRSWVLYPDLNLSALRRDVDQAIGILAARRGQPPSAYPLVYRAPGQSDAGFGQVGCLLALLSAVAGDILGTAAILFVEPGRASVLGPLLAVITGGFIVPLATGDVVPELVGRIARLRSNAENVGYLWMLIAPGVVAAVTVWLVAFLGD
jgi:hypothetical protein